MKTMSVGEMKLKIQKFMPYVRYMVIVWVFAFLFGFVLIYILDEILAGFITLFIGIIALLFNIYLSLTINLYLIRVQLKEITDDIEDE